MNRGGTEPRPSSLRLGQIMAVVGIVAAASGLASTIHSLKGGSTEVHFVLAWILCYVLYLGFLLILSRSYFTKTQILTLMASAGALSVLMIQTVATSSGEKALAAMLVLPILPFVLGLLMYRFGRSPVDEDDAVSPEASETLAALIRNKRNRGLSPQAGPEFSLDEANPDKTDRKTILIWSGIIIAVMAIGGYLQRRSYNLRLAEFHSREDNRCSERALDIRDKLNEAEAKLEVDPASSNALGDSIAAWKREADEYTRKARWHAKKSEEYATRW